MITDIYVKINFSRTQKISQRLTNVQEVFIQGTQLNIEQNSELYSVLTCPIPVTLFLAMCILENWQLHSSGCE